MATIPANLNLTPEEAVRLFAAKGEQLAWDYTDVWRGANVHAFTVAKATSLDVLRTIRTEVAKSIEGQTFETFKRNLRPRLEELGWWGRQEVLDADTGELTTAQLGSVRRLRTIYQTNVQTSYMAGRFKRLVDDAADRPYWRYVAIMDGRTRPHHAALHGKVWRWDDPVWQVIWPPNGWGCRCRVTALTEAEFRALGVQLENGADAIVELQVPIGREGETVAVQGVRYTDAGGRDRVFRPDPGWDYNPGAEWSRFDGGGGTPEADLPALDGLPTWVDEGRPALSELRQWLPDPGLLPRSPDAEARAQVLADVLLQGRARREVVTPVETVAIVRELLPTTEGAERFANYVVPVLEQPFEVWLTPYEDGTYRKRYIGLVHTLTMLVRENRDGSLHWEVYQDESIDLLRAGRLLYGQPLDPEGSS